MINVSTKLIADNDEYNNFIEKENEQYEVFYLRKERLINFMNKYYCETDDMYM